MSSNWSSHAIFANKVMYMYKPLQEIYVNHGHHET